MRGRRYPPPPALGLELLAERYKQAFYELDEEELRPYFELSRVSDAIFSLATRLYGIRFTERTDLPVYHSDVHTYEVHDADGSYLGLLYTDFFPREGKQSGAWMNNLQEQYHTAEGEDHRPHIRAGDELHPAHGRPAPPCSRLARYAPSYMSSVTPCMVCSPHAVTARSAGPTSSVTSSSYPAS